MKKVDLKFLNTLNLDPLKIHIKCLIQKKE